MSDEAKTLSEDEAKVWRPLIRDLIKHEDDLVNQRLTWLIQVQGLLFAALAFAWSKGPRELIFLLSFLGIATAVSLWTAIRMYSPTIRKLHQWWVDHRPKGSIEGPDVIGLYSPSSGLTMLLRPWRALPIIFTIAWVGVIVVLGFLYGKGSAPVGG